MAGALRLPALHRYMHKFVGWVSEAHPPEITSGDMVIQGG